MNYFGGEILKKDNNRFFPDRLVQQGLERNIGVLDPPSGRKKEDKQNTAYKKKNQQGPRKE